MISFNKKDDAVQSFHIKCPYTLSHIAIYHNVAIGNNPGGGTDSLKVANMCRPTAPPFTCEVEMTALSTGKFELTAPCFYSNRAPKS